MDLDGFGGFSVSVHPMSSPEVPSAPGRKHVALPPAKLHN